MLGVEATKFDVIEESCDLIFLIPGIFPCNEETFQKLYSIHCSVFVSFPSHKPGLNVHVTFCKQGWL